VDEAMKKAVLSVGVNKDRAAKTSREMAAPHGEVRARPFDQGAIAVLLDEFGAETPLCAHSDCRALRHRELHRISIEALGAVSASVLGEGVRRGAELLAELAAAPQVPCARSSRSATAGTFES
jgi:hypothetical protein